MNEGISFLLRLVPYAVLIMCIFIVCKAVASGNAVKFMNEALPVFGGLFVILVLSQAMA